MSQAAPKVKCGAACCTVKIDPTVDAVCARHQKLVPPDWLKRWKTALKQKSAAKITRDKFNALREVEFIRATCIGATLRTLPALIVAVLLCACGGGSHTTSRTLPPLDTLNVGCAAAIFVGWLAFAVRYQG